MKLIIKKTSEVTLRNAYAQNFKHLQSKGGPLLAPFFKFWTNFDLDIFWESSNFASCIACLIAAFFKMLSWVTSYATSLVIHICIIPFFCIRYIFWTPFQYKRLMRENKETGDLEREVKIWSFGRTPSTGNDSGIIKKIKQEREEG